MTHDFLHYSDGTIKKTVSACFQENNLTGSEELQNKMISDYGKKDPDRIRSSGFLFFPLIDRIPKGRAQIILAGIWSSIPFIICYPAALITVCHH